MSNNFMLVLRWFFSTALSFLTGVHLPGTNVTPLGFILFSVLTYLVIKFLMSLAFVSSFGRSSGGSEHEQ